MITKLNFYPIVKYVIYIVKYKMYRKMQLIWNLKLNYNG